MRKILKIVLVDGCGYITKNFTIVTYLGSIFSLVRQASGLGYDEILICDPNKYSEKAGSAFLEGLVSVSEIPLSLAIDAKFDHLVHALESGFDKAVLPALAKLGDSKNAAQALASRFGSQAVSIVFDLDFVDGGYNIVNYRAGRRDPRPVIDVISNFDMAGELILQNVALDGTLSGVDREALTLVSDQDRPIVLTGGYTDEDDNFLNQARVSAAASTFFVMHQASIMNRNVVPLLRRVD